ncbi:hypothetical protein [Rouxiella sp. Mn2063]|uniref:hypothetical protein n=1 Tax=Rouxiella sp. Mn2063 TaxID=3395262 RepID=UPI003BE33BA5
MNTIIRLFFFFHIFLSTIVEAVEKNPCAIPASSVGISMTDAMLNDFKISRSTIVENKTKMELIDNVKVDSAFSDFMAKEDKVKDTDNFVSLEEYRGIYREGNPRNLIVKVSYENKERKHNIFLASSIVNDDECSIRFNGYIIIKREF